MPKIFLSSTFVDLAPVRQEISRWLLQVFGAELVIMETFGSDADPPDVVSVRRVRECDLFIGIYAHRYGTVEEVSGKSVTELELDEAERAYSGGTIRDILLYLLDPTVDWPQEYRELSEPAPRRLAGLREKAKRHTCSYFKSKYDLLLSITRDVHRKLLEHFSTSPLRIRPFALPPASKLGQPVGMEFLSSRHRQHLAGRDSKIGELMVRIEHDPLVLLLGDSGVGKTSLVSAGLIPLAVEQGWRPIYARSFGFPSTDILQQIQANLFEGRSYYRGLLPTFLAEISPLMSDVRFLLIIDQFEDILVARDEREVAKLISELQQFYNSPLPSVRILLAYRADLEGRLGPYWQAISGSPSGLPRIYLEGIAIADAWESVCRAAADLGITINLTTTEQEQIKSDLELSSSTVGVSGIYPPYVQMLLDHLWTSTNHGKEPCTGSRYLAARGMEGVIGGYLDRQLDYAQDSAGHIRLVLISLVRSYGVKAQRTLTEIVAETGLEAATADVALEKLIDLRLVRHVEDYYEVSHDFIARKILSELVDSDERELKRFRELLTSKAAAFPTTQAHLTPEELLMLFAHREKVVPNELELRLLLASWVAGEGPALYWILNPQHREQILNWLRAEEAGHNLDRDRDRQVSILLLRRKLEDRPFDQKDYNTLRGYQYGIELASSLLQHRESLPAEVLLTGLRHERHEVKEACREILVDRLNCGEWELIDRIRASGSRACQEFYEALVLRPDITVPENKRTRAIQEFRLLRALAFAEGGTEIEASFAELKAIRPRGPSLVFGQALRQLRQKGVRHFLKTAKNRPQKYAEIALRALSGDVTATEFDLMLTTYCEWNEVEGGTTLAVSVKANSLARAILRCMRPTFLPQLRRIVTRIRLAGADSSRTLVLSLLKFGTAGDVKLALDRIANEEGTIYFYNHTELGRAVAKRMAEIESSVPIFLSTIIGKREFWEYLSAEYRTKAQREDLLPLKNIGNRPLYIRLAGYAAVGISGEKDAETLEKLVNHNYKLIARAAALKLIHVLGEGTFKKLTAAIKESLSRGAAESLADAIRHSEIELYSLAHFW